MTQPNYPLRFLRTVNRHMKNGTPVKTCREVTKMFLETLYSQNPDLSQKEEVKFDFSVIPSGFVLASSLDGSLVINPKPHREHIESYEGVQSLDRIKFPCYFK